MSGESGGAPAISTAVANLSVTEFCRQLGVSITTLYYWKKRVHEAPANTLGRVLANAPRAG